MASKYGQQLYGRDLYSSALAQLEGSLSFAVLAGAGSPLTKLFQLQGTGLSFSVILGATFTAARTFVGDLPFATTYSAIILDINNFTGNIPVNMVLAGELFRSATRAFVGDLPVIIDLQGSLTRLYKLDANPLSFAVNIGGGSDIYLGPFWAPDVPTEDGWAPESPAEGGWASAEPDESPPWVPAMPDRQWS